MIHRNLPGTNPQTDVRPWCPWTGAFAASLLNPSLLNAAASEASNGFSGTLGSPHLKPTASGLYICSFPEVHHTSICTLSQRAWDPWYGMLDSIRNGQRSRVWPRAKSFPAWLQCSNFRHGQNDHGLVKSYPILPACGWYHFGEIRSYGSYQSWPGHHCNKHRFAITWKALHGRWLAGEWAALTRIYPVMLSWFPK